VPKNFFGSHSNTILSFTEGQSLPSSTVCALIFGRKLRVKGDGMNALRRSPWHNSHRGRRSEAILMLEHYRWKISRQ